MLPLGRRRVEKEFEQRNRPFGAVDDLREVDVWPDGEPSVREQAEHFCRVFGANDVAVAEQNQSRSLDGADFVGRPAFEV